MTDDKEIYNDVTRFRKDLLLGAGMLIDISTYTYKRMVENHQDTTNLNNVHRSLAATLATYSRLQPHKLRGLIRVLRKILGKIPPDTDNPVFDDVSVEDYLSELYSQIKFKSKE